MLKTLPDNSIDAVVTDPPYGFSFMGKKWDYDVPSVELWEECLRVLKPGGHLLAFAGTRTQHRMAVRIEDAGFEIRDMLAWVYGSGFPKSLDVSKAIDKMAGAEREKIGRGKGRTGAAAQPNGGSVHSDDNYQWPGEFDITAPATAAAKEWAGWGTALKPSMETITMARKPLGEGTVAANVLAWGTGGINVDGCRVEATGERLGGGGENRATFAGKDGWGRPWMQDEKKAAIHSAKVKSNVEKASSAGRWPANFVHDGSDEVVGMFPQSKSCNSPSKATPLSKYRPTQGGYQPQGRIYPGDTGSASRFFYCAKASRSEREAGCEGLEEREKKTLNDYVLPSEGRTAPKCGSPARNAHPTVKPIALMRWLCRLVTPPDGVILDPFMGSGTTGAAAMLEGFNFIGIEREPEYIEIAQRRIAHWKDEAGEADDKQPELFESYG